MPKRFKEKLNGRGEWSGQLDLADVYDEVSIDAHPYDYATVQLIGANALTWGTGSIKVRRSNNGVSAVDFGTPVSLAAVGCSAEQTVRANGYLHLVVGSSADPTTASGMVEAHVKFHRV